MERDDASTQITTLTFFSQVPPLLAARAGFELSVRNLSHPTERRRTQDTDNVEQPASRAGHR